MEINPSKGKSNPVTSSIIIILPLGDSKSTKKKQTEKKTRPEEKKTDIAFRHSQGLKY